MPDTPGQPDARSRERASAGAGEHPSRRSHPSGRTDDQLLKAWRRGEVDALTELLRGYQSRVFAVCYRMLQSPDEATDLTQDALAKIIEGLHTYDGRSQLSTWVIRVAMNCCLSHLRKLRLRRHGSIDDPTAVIDRSLVSEPRPEDRVERQERRAALERALDRLDPEMRSIIVLRDVQGLEYQQIGAVMGVPVGTVKSRLFRARVALRELVTGDVQANAEGVVPDATPDTIPSPPSDPKPAANSADKRSPKSSPKPDKSPKPTPDTKKRKAGGTASENDY